MSFKISRASYAAHYGPTVGDRIRLADTELLIEIEKDFTHHGDEVVFGGGKVIRDGLGQCPYHEHMSTPHLDLVITNVVVVDYWASSRETSASGTARSSPSASAGNPLIQPGIDPRLVIGPGTEVIAGEGMICTAGGLDTHVHMICPQQVEVAIAAGITTMIGGGTGSATGTWATTCTPGPLEHHADAAGRRGTARSTGASWAREIAACPSCSKTRCGPGPAV